MSNKCGPEAQILVPAPADRTILILRLAVGNRLPATWTPKPALCEASGPVLLDPGSRLRSMYDLHNDFINSMVGHSSLVSPPPTWAPCCCLVVQSCPALCDPVDSSLPGSCVRGILRQTTGVGGRFLLQGEGLSDLPNPGIKPVSPAF